MCVLPCNLRTLFTTAKQWRTAAAETGAGQAELDAPCGWCDFAHIYHNFTRSPRRAVTTRTHSSASSWAWCRIKNINLSAATEEGKGKGAWKLHFAFYEQTTFMTSFSRAQRDKGLWSNPLKLFVNTPRRRYAAERGRGREGEKEGKRERVGRLLSDRSSSSWRRLAPTTMFELVININVAIKQPNVELVIGINSESSAEGGWYRLVDALHAQYI